ncbi:MAG: hypothetical protein P9L99_09555 [Candidatus Lernaella stagnicola]|nr:hypothetical protein [Candidatus Lernaella stagnicola]
MGRLIDMQEQRLRLRDQEKRGEGYILRRRNTKRTQRRKLAREAAQRMADRLSRHPALSQLGHLPAAASKWEPPRLIHHAVRFEVIDGGRRSW